jgi:hypothetical protein
MCAHQVRPYVRLVSTDDHTNEPANGQPSTDQAPAQRYEIRVRGHLGPRWTTWFDGMSLTAEDDGTTVIRGPVVDQSALHGLLQILRDLGITLLSLTPLPADRAVEQADDSHNQTHHQSPGATS